jgi:galactokinase
VAGSASFLREGFREKYGEVAITRLVRAPGRVNLIGEHTDYSLGFVLPVALQMACHIAVGPSDDGRLRVWSENVRQSREWAVEDLGNLEPAGEWSDYVAGVARELTRAGCRVRPSNLFLWSTVPVGSGLSSSAALEVATAMALLDESSGLTRLDIARLCQRAETEFVGLPCGIMDQYISVFGEAGCAVRIDCRSLEHSAVRLPPGVSIVAVNSMVKHELGGSAYRDRVRECREAVDAVRARHPEVASLRDVSVPQLDGCADAMSQLVYRRARHVVTENARVEEFMTASAANDLTRMGELFVASHRSLQHDYEVSCPELDFLVDRAIAMDGVHGARMTGGGFGGCTVNLVRSDAVDRFRAAIAAIYRERYEIEAQSYVCEPGDGAGEIR